MSYEGKMLSDLKMPSKQKVEEALLFSLFNHNGVVKDFSTGEDIVEEIADLFDLNGDQRKAYLETIYRKENRVKRSYLWHRLLFRAADSLAKEKLVSRPTQTIKLTNKKEWMLTEKGYDRVLQLLKIPRSQKELLSVRSYEVQKLSKKFKETKRPTNYNPIDKNRSTRKITRETSIRLRGFRQAVIESYDFRCAVCGMKISSPNLLYWEVEAAHIIPHSSMGKDDILNGLCLCRFHHWAFDVGWFSLTDDYALITSSKINDLPNTFGKMWDYDLASHLSSYSSKIFLPEREEIYPHHHSLRWHRENIFCE